MRELAYLLAAKSTVDFLLEGYREASKENINATISVAIEQLEKAKR